MNLKIKMVSGDIWNVRDIKDQSFDDFLIKNMAATCMTFLNNGKTGNGKPFTLIVKNIESIESV